MTLTIERIMTSGKGHVTLEMTISGVEAQVHPGCVLNNNHIINYVLICEGMPHIPLYLTEVSLAYASFSVTLRRHSIRFLVFGRFSTTLKAQSSSLAVALRRKE